MQTTRVVLAVLFSSLALGGDLSAGDRFYPGEPLPPNQVALVMVDVMQCRIDFLTLEGKPEVQLSPKKNQVELLPGQHHLCVHYGVGFRPRNCADVALNAQAGHTYYIYGQLGHLTEEVGRYYTEAGRHYTWRPVVVDFAREEDYITGKEGKRTQQRALKYFQGDRLPAKEKVGKGHDVLFIFGGSYWE